MDKSAIKIVRPWPAEQPRPPMTRHTEEAQRASSPSSTRHPRERAAPAGE